MKTQLAETELKNMDGNSPSRAATGSATVTLCNGALAVCFVLEMLLWWKLNFNPWVLAATFVAGFRGSVLTRRRIAKESPNDVAHRSAPGVTVERKETHE